MEADFSKDKILNRVRKLMAMADPESGATEGERDNALRMAHATLAKYNLTMAEAEASSGKKDEPRVDKAYETRDFPWMRATAQSIAHLFFCEYFYTRRRGGKVHHFVIGRETNVATAAMMIQFVITSVDKEGLRMELAREGRSKGGTYWRSFCKGAAWRIETRCQDLRAQAEAASAKEVEATKLLTTTAKAPGTALVLASVYEQEQKGNLVHMAQKMGIGDGDIKEKRTRQFNTNWSAAADGRRYGDSINLTPVPTGSKNPRLK